MLDALATKAFDMAKDAAIGPVYAAQIQMLGEHINYLQTQLEDTKSKQIKAESKLEAQIEELENLRSQLATFAGKAKCIEIGPCFIKQAQTGQPLDGVYCPHCQSLMTKGQYSSYGDNFSYMCCNSKCYFTIPADDVERALAEFSL